MKSIIVILLFLVTSCKLKFTRTYINNLNGRIINKYYFDKNGRYLKNIDCDLVDYVDSGLFVKKGNKYYLYNNDIEDTLFDYSYKESSKRDNGYYVDLSNLSIRRDNKCALNLTQDSLEIKIDGKILSDYSKERNMKILRFNKPVIAIEVKGSLGMVCIDFISLSKNKIVEFKKNGENDVKDYYFKVSVLGNIIVYNKFSGTSLYFARKFKRKRMVYK